MPRTERVDMTESLGITPERDEELQLELFVLINSVEKVSEAIKEISNIDATETEKVYLAIQLGRTLRS